MQVHGADEAACPDRGPKGENRASDDLTPSLGDEDARLRKIDQLSQQVS